MIDQIDWQLLATAVDYYKSLGFEYVEVPWKVSVDSAKVTCPSDGILEMSDDLVLIASAEQGFIDLVRDGLLPRDKGGVNYVACTPCFRVQDAERSILHHPYFMKVELFVRLENEDQGDSTVKELMHKARRLMGMNGAIPEVRKFDDGTVDLEIDGIEVGSYGWKWHRDVGLWAYGTGLALPRFSQALEFTAPADKIVSKE